MKISKKLQTIMEKYFDIVGYGIDKHITLMESYNATPTILKKMVLEIISGNNLNTYTKTRLPVLEYRQLHKIISEEFSKFNETSPKSLKLFEKVIRGDLSGKFSDINAAALDSRKRGYSTFMFNGKTYTTHMKGEDNNKWNEELNKIRSSHNNKPYADNETPPNLSQETSQPVQPATPTAAKPTEISKEQIEAVLTKEQYIQIQKKIYTEFEKSGLDWLYVKQGIDGYVRFSDENGYKGTTFKQFYDQMSKLIYNAGIEDTNKIKEMLTPNTSSTLSYGNNKKLDKQTLDGINDKLEQYMKSNNTNQILSSDIMEYLWRLQPNTVSYNQLKDYVIDKLKITPEQFDQITNTKQPTTTQNSQPAAQQQSPQSQVLDQHKIDNIKAKLTNYMKTNNIDSSSIDPYINRVKPGSQLTYDKIRAYVSQQLKITPEQFDQIINSNTQQTTAATASNTHAASLSP